MKSISDEIQSDDRTLQTGTGDSGQSRAPMGGAGQTELDDLGPERYHDLDRDVSSDESDTEERVYHGPYVDEDLEQDDGEYPGLGHL